MGHEAQRQEAGRPWPSVARDARETFAERVKEIDSLFRKGDLKAFWPRLRTLVRMAPDRTDLSRKKSHYLVSLAWRSVLRGDLASARRFLAYADRHVNPTHLTPYFVRERAEHRRRLEAAEARAQEPKGP